MEKAGVLLLKHQPLRDHPDAALVYVDGSIDPKTQNQFKGEIDKILGGGVNRLFLDCAKLTYINSSGLAYILNVVGALKPKGGMVGLAAMDSKIMVIFNMMGITELFKFYPTSIAAVRELDEKLAKELADVGPALKLDDPPKPPPTPKPASAPLVRKSGSRTDRITKPIRTIPPPPPPRNPIVQFFCDLFGIETTSTSSWIRRKRR
jgi:anti-anti-sigma factor